MDDRILLERAAAGDEVAFELTVRRHAEAVWRLARSLLGDDFAAEEAAQDTFLKAYRSLGGYRGDASVRTWLLAICHHTCLDRLRLKRAVIVPLDELRRARAREDTAELRIALDAALAALPDEERRAFTLVEILGHTREEAASIAGVPPSTMRSRVSRARARLAEALAEPGSGFGRQRDTR